MQTFKNSNQMKAFMKKEARRLDVNIHNAYSTFVARSFLERLSKYNDNSILIKGSSAELCYLGALVRCVTDVDIASLESLNVNRELLERVITDEKVDNFKFSLVKKPRKTKTGIYKFSLQADFDGIRQPLSVDLQDNYTRLIEPEKRIMPPIFDGDEPFEVFVPSFEEYLAEKLCIIIESNKANVLNTRVKDFYDIYELHGGKYDSEKLTEYFGKMLLLRGKINLDDAQTMYLNKKFIDSHSGVWDSTKEKYDFLDKEIDLQGAVYYTRAVIREQLQKHGNVMTDSASWQYKR